VSFSLGTLLIIMTTTAAQIAALTQEIAYLKGNQTAFEASVAASYTATGDLDVAWLVLCGWFRSSPRSPLALALALALAPASREPRLRRLALSGACSRARASVSLARAAHAHTG